MVTIISATQSDKAYPDLNNPGQEQKPYIIKCKATASSSTNRNSAFFEMIGASGSTFTPSMFINEDRIQRVLDKFEVDTVEQLVGKEFDTLGARFEVMHPNAPQYDDTEAGVGGWYASRDNEDVLFRLSIVPIEDARVVQYGTEEGVENPFELGNQTKPEAKSNTDYASMRVNDLKALITDELGADSLKGVSGKAELVALAEEQIG